VTRYMIGDLRTGRRLQDVQVVTGPWKKGLNGPGTVTITVAANDPDIKRLGLGNVATPGKAFLAVIENDVIMEAGPIWTHEYDRDDGTLVLAAAGLWSYFDHRVLVPVLATGQSPVGADTNLSNLTLGTIAKRLVQQAQTHTGGNVPVVFLPDEVDPNPTNERNYLGADLGLVGDRLEDLTNVIGGPDIDFAPRFTPDRLGIEWVMRTGTKAQPQLSANTSHVWDISVAQTSVRKLKVRRTAEKLVARAWATGGRQSDTVMTSRYDNPTLTDAGFPLLESVDSSHSSVSVQSTLDDYAREAARVGYKPISFWSFEVRADASPQVGVYQIGDYCRLKLKGDPYLPDNVTDGHQRRIVSISGDEQGKWISITTGEVYSLDA
jgi:hypothetical protein